MKQQVRFIRAVRPITVGMPAFVDPVDHPSDLVSNTTTVITSPVVGILDMTDGIVTRFETANTVYTLEDNA